MKFARIGDPGQEQPIVQGSDGVWRDATSLAPDIAATNLVELVALTDDQIQDLPETDPTGHRYGPPVSGVGKIVCVGLNYSDHAEETGMQPPDEPVLFFKAADTIVGPDDDVFVPRGSTKTDWEVELAVVIGATARYLDSPAAARAHIAGYAISHDVSEREFQLERGGQWDKGKNCETFNPFGPWLVTADEVADPQQLGLRLTVNDEVRQDGTTANMLFNVDHLVWYISQFMVLYPGDVINTGTPAGVALGLPGNPYLRPGDKTSLTIDGLGNQTQLFKEAP